jgi:hypothetical protein
MARGFAVRGGVGDRRFGARRHWGEPLFEEQLIADPPLAAIEEAPFGDDFRHPGMGMRGGMRGGMGGGQTQGVTQAIQQLKQAVDGAGRGGSLVALQAVPSGGPNGAVG